MEIRSSPESVSWKTPPADCGAEFLRLVVGARHQGHAGDAGRKSEVVLDPRRGAGLAAERAAVEHQHGQSLRGGINRGGEAGGTGADDGHVIDAVRIDRSHEADAAREFEFARIVQQLSVRTEHDRQLTRIDVKALDQGLGLGVGLRIEPLLRMAVAREKIRQPQHVAVVGPADDHRAAGARLEQADAAENERAHDARAELGFRDQQRAQPVGRYGQSLRIDQGRLARQLRQFAHERAGPVADDQLTAAGPRRLGHVDLAGQDDEQALADGPGLGERFTGAEGPQRAEAPDPLDLGRLQHREHLVAAGVDDRWLRHGHNRHSFGPSLPELGAR